MEGVTRNQSMHMKLMVTYHTSVQYGVRSYVLTAKSRDEETDLLNDHPTGFLLFLQASGEKGATTG